MNTKRSFIFLLLICISLSQTYDLIFVGLGSSSSIVLSKLVKQFPQKSFLAIELGGPTSAAIGGTNYPSYFQNQPANNKATITDVPGEYSNTPFNSQGEPYRISQIEWTWQGKGFGGNSQFNGMLYQEAPNDYLNSLPAGWQASDLRPYFNEIRSKMTISTTPSADKKTYLGGIHDTLAAVFATLGWTQQDTSNLGNLGKPGYFSRPYVASDGNGKRAGPVSAYLTSVVGGNGLPSVSNLQIVPFAQVQKILFSTTNNKDAIGVVYTKDGSNTQITASLKAGGRVVCGAGALMTPRLLYLSGVGPTGKESQVMDNPSPFVRNNVKVGANVYDHVGTQLAFTYKGARTVETIKYGDYAANQGVINQYVTSKSGPYAQYGPVSVAHAASDAGKAFPNYELFTNPGGPGGADKFNGPKSFQIVSMLYRPKSTEPLGLDFLGNVRFPNIYFTNDADANDQTNAISTTLNNVLGNKNEFELIVGPGSQTNPNLNPQNFNDVKQYVTSGNGYEGVQGSRLIMNHWTGTVPLTSGSEDAGGVDPATLRLRSTSNVYVVDASLLPGSIPCHPIATVMAIGAKAADVMAASLNTDPSSSTSATAAPTRSSSTAAPTSSSSSSAAPATSTKTTASSGSPPATTGGSASCSQCPPNLRCCYTSATPACFDPSRYTCTTESDGKSTLCQFGYEACKGVCYLTSSFICTPTGVAPKPTGSSATPAPSSSTVGTAAPTRSSTSTSATAAPTRTSATAAPTRSSTSATVAPTTSKPTTTAPTSTGGPVRCGAGFCGGSDQCCNGQCYNSANYVCTIDNNGKLYLCPIGYGSCNGQCYSPNIYTCQGGVLKPKRR
eukprot:TRINITY_DN515_c0_g1_i1.p1 TRINITY_DN515_c0_g1~~TRINITY_DN515_c0_g1_i1.p1  ORF type:complete len:839 (-),score=254.86 TRINITY_DN515_c0_g1_i1:211-2727(-)